LLQNLGTLVLLLLVLPINTGIVLVSLLLGKQQKAIATKPKNILMSGGVPPATN
jgi:hypothetical protein